MDTTRKSVHPDFPFHISQSIKTGLNPIYTKPYFKIIYIKKGELFNENTSVPSIYKSDSVILIPPKEEVSFSINEKPELFFMLLGQEFLKKTTVIIGNSTISAQFMLNEKDLRHIMYIPLITEVSSRVHTLMETIFFEFSDQKEGYRSLISLKFSEVLITIYREQLLSKSRRIDKNEIKNIDDVIEYIKQNYTDHFSLKELSSKCGLNFSYFSRAFKEKTGMPLFEYINTKRIEKACKLLRKTDMAIIEIAYAVGYNNISFFNRYFRRIMHTSPGEYKRSR